MEHQLTSVEVEEELRLGCCVNYTAFELWGRSGTASTWIIRNTVFIAHVKSGLHYNRTKTLQISNTYNNT